MRRLLSAFIAGEILFLFLSELPTRSNFIEVAIASVAFICFALIANLFLIKLKRWIQWFYLLGILGFGFLWVGYLSVERQAHRLPAAYENIDLLLIGVVDGLPKWNDEGVRFSFAIEQVYTDDLSHVIDLNNFPKRVSLGWYSGWSKSKSLPIVKPGQRWSLPVRLKKPHGSMNPHGFDFERWMFVQGLGANGSVKSNTKGLYLSWRPTLKEDFVYGFTAFIERIRWSLREKILQAVPDGRYVGVLAALVMGDQNSIQQKDWHVFNATGIGHLISISGLHVTMLASFGSCVVGWLWRRRCLPLICPVQKVAALGGVVVALIYTWLAGFQIPAQRTTYMVAVVAIALWSGRITRGFDIWWWALGAVLLIDPWAIYTPGFWLSFGAVAAILYAMPGSDAISEYASFQKPTWQESLKEAVRVQAVVTVALVPITFYWFYQASIVSPLANAIAIPVISYVVTPLALLGSILPEVISTWVLWLAHQAMVLVAWFIEPLGQWSWAVIRQAQPPWWAVLVACLGLVWVIQPGPILKLWKKRLIGLGASILLFIPQDSGLGEGDYRVIVLDIGQGTAVLVETQSRRLLYDTGPKLSKLSDAGERTILPYLQGRGISKIDRLVISHKDADHIGGALSLFQGIRFDDVIGTLPQYHYLTQAIRAQKIPALPCKAGQRWSWGGITFKVWHPESHITFDPVHHKGKPNALSCVIEVSNGYFSTWLSGDVEIEGETIIANEYKLPDGLASILLVPHHGSATSSSTALLDALQPRWAIVQAGYKNRYRHPVPRVMQRYEARGIPVFETVHTGAQIWEFRKDQMSLNHWRNLQRRFWHHKP